jgi:hypothetical protein
MDAEAALEEIVEHGGRVSGATRAFRTLLISVSHQSGREGHGFSRAS